MYLWVIVQKSQISLIYRKCPVIVNKEPGIVAHVCDPRIWGAEARRSVQDQPGKHDEFHASLGYG